MIEKAKFLMYYRETTTIEDADQQIKSSLPGALKSFTSINLPKTNLKFGEILSSNQYWNKLKQLGWEINN